MHDNGLDISEINTAFLKNFVNYIETEPSQKGDNRKKKQAKITHKGGRVVSLDLTCIRAIHNKAKAEYSRKKFLFNGFENFSPSLEIHTNTDSQKGKKEKAATVATF